MKEFSAQTGGRYTYVDDIMNLQELSLAFTSIFSECDHFIISGCQVSGQNISPGYIYLNGKVRYFSGASAITTWPQYIYELNTTESVAYASGSDKVGRNSFGCAIAATVPTAFDAITQAVPTFISIPTTGGRQMKDAFFGKYALLLQPTTGSQTVNGLVSFSSNVTCASNLTTNGRSIVSTGLCKGAMYYDGKVFVVESQASDGKLHKMTIAEDGTFQFIVDGVSVFAIAKDKISFSKPVEGAEGRFGNISVLGNHVFNNKVAADNGCLYLNMLGFNGGSANYRDTYIGNGKNTAVLSIFGATSCVQVDGQLSLVSAEAVGLSLRSGLKKSNMALQKSVIWYDVDGENMAQIGYTSASHNIFEIKNTIAPISIVGVTAVDIGPAIKENGVLLSEKYVSIQTYQQDISSKVDGTAVYSKTAADNKFATKDGGFQQFISSAFAKSTLRKQIDAVSATEVVNVCPTLAGLLSDMADTETKKAQICANIGAARTGDFQAKLSDTGWVLVTTGLYARQIGNIVCVQGKVKLAHDGGAIFTLPNSIDAPRYDVTFSTMRSSSSQWAGVIYANTKKMVAVECSMHSYTVPLSITYMI